MYYYKNTSRTAKTFHGITFKPGETHSVSSYINDTSMIRLPSHLVDKIKKEQHAVKTSSKSSTNVKAADKPSGKTKVVEDKKEVSKDG